MKIIMPDDENYEVGPTSFAEWNNIYMFKALRYLFNCKPFEEIKTLVVSRAGLQAYFKDKENV